MSLKTLKKAELITHAEHLERVLNACETSLHNYKSENTRLKRDLKKAKDQVNTKESKLTKANERLSKLSSAVDKITLEREAVFAELSELREVVISLENEKSVLQDELQTKVRINLKLEGVIKRLKKNWFIKIFFSI